ncbi:hypothetical protein FQA47_021813 [Oryzias melastigma]|uniref:Uncharacterized protein n=1 Tax=Oryzias melastigma TaxID=30732 RepID=A0A834FR98_ORYME|nr:hypothetical protein FQA47_021813 [Oryzias melastigma]
MSFFLSDFDLNPPVRDGRSRCPGASPGCPTAREGSSVCQNKASFLHVSFTLVPQTALSDPLTGLQAAGSACVRGSSTADSGPDRAARRRDRWACAAAEELEAGGPACTPAEPPPGRTGVHGTVKETRPVR